MDFSTVLQVVLYVIVSIIVILGALLVLGTGRLPYGALYVLAGCVWAMFDALVLTTPRIILHWLLKLTRKRYRKPAPDGPQLVE